MSKYLFYNKKFSVVSIVADSFDVAYNKFISDKYLSERHFNEIFCKNYDTKEVVMYLLPPF